MRTVTLLILLFICIPSIAQEVIHFNNPSFEDYPRKSKPPENWYDCGFKGETPPDVQPVGRQGFGVTQVPSEGDTYLGLVTRDNDTWEQVGQELSTPLKMNESYIFSVDLSQEDYYVSLSKMTQDTVNYNQPVVFRVWGGSKLCEEKEVLAVSPIIAHSDWKRYTFKIVPKYSWEFIVLGIYYGGNPKYATNGNLLVDNLSTIVLLDSLTKQSDLIDLESILRDQEGRYNPYKATKKNEVEPTEYQEAPILENEQRLPPWIKDLKPYQFKNLTWLEFSMLTDNVAVWDKEKYPFFYALRVVKKFGVDLEKNGVRNSIMTARPDEWALKMETLKLVGGEKHVAILKKAIGIYARRNTKLTNEELTYFDRSEELFNELEYSILEICNQYREAHADELYEELQVILDK